MRVTTCLGAAFLLSVLTGCDQEQHAEFAEQTADARRMAGEVGHKVQEAATEATIGKPTLVINLVSGEEDLHAVAMGLHLAEHGLEAGREVVVFFNVKAPPLARASLADSVQFGDEPPVKKVIASLVERGATALVCPMCAQIMGVTAEELASGIEMVADRNQLFDPLQANTVVFTY